ncbi:MAG: single-stranded-DNA-specific exonuclease RecJ [Chitinispirillia bacterium]|jgi:single-stranded-DNA-specific exonuclease
MIQFNLPKEIIHIKEADPEIVRSLSKELGVSEAVGKTLVCRNLKTYEECKKFFRPQFSHFHDPFLFRDMERIVHRIISAIDSRQKIVIYGDYDVDGITATVLLVSFLRKMGAVCDYYLPNRLTDGYGISKQGISDIKKRNGSIIITVDCGITALDEIRYASNRGIDVIVTDHHETIEELPDAVGILDPKIEDSNYPERNLAGVGVALKLCHSLAMAKNYDDSFWLDYLDITAFGTIADIVPLVGENRTIVKLGLERLTHTKNLGLQKLINYQNLTGKTLSTGDVGFILAPCINAAGRLGKSNHGVKLLLADNETEASKYAKGLVLMNKKRRSLDKYVYDSTIKWIYHNVDLKNDYVIVAGDPSWHVGVIGITASKIVEQFFRPTFLFSHGDNGYAKGSGRGVNGLHLLDALKECSGYLESYGGHETAAGATIKIENITKFREHFNSVVKSLISIDKLVPHIFVDAEIDVEQLTPKLYRIIKQMEPFGSQNARPVLLCHGLNNYSKPRIVGKKHLKMRISKDGQVIEAIAFNFGDRIQDIVNSNNFSLAFSLDENTWNGRKNLQLKVKGMM